MAKKDYFTKNGSYIYNREFRGGNVKIIKQKDDSKIDFDGIIAERTINGKYEKDLFSCEKVLFDDAKTIVRGEKCSAISCECDKKVCDKNDFCGKTHPVAVVEFEGMQSAEGMNSKTLRSNTFEYDRQELNDATLRKFLRL